MKQRVGLAGVAFVAVVCFGLGIVTQRVYDARRRPVAPVVQNKAPAEGEPHAPESAGVNVATIDFEHEPLWAYGFLEPPKPGEKAQPQTPPTRNLRPNQDPAEQTKARQVDGSSATYSLVDIRDGQNVIDWFPGDHPPMPNVVAHGPAQLGKTTRGCGSCHLPNGKGRPENAPPVGTARRVFRPADRRLPERPAPHGRSAQAEHQHDDRPREGDDRRRDESRRRVLLGHAVDAVDPRRRDERWCRRRVSSAICSCPRSHAATEPIDGRIIEMPEDEEQAETLRNPALGLCRLRAGGQRQEGRGSRHDRRHAHRRQQDRAGQDDGVRHVSRRESDGRGRRAADRRPVAELPGAAAVGHPAGHAQRAHRRS